MNGNPDSSDYDRQTSPIRNSPLAICSAQQPPIRHSPFAIREASNAERIVQIARQWIGTPYVHQASLKGVGCDCLGLLRGIWRELRGEEPEAIPPYSPDWAEATGAETLYMALARHSTEVPVSLLSPGDIALFRLSPHSPAKHCGAIGIFPPPFTGEGDREAVEGARRTHAPSASRANGALSTSPVNGGGKLTLIHARANKRVSEEPFSPFWRAKLAYAFRL